MRAVGLLIGLMLFSLSSCMPSLFKGMEKQGKETACRKDLFPLFDGCDSTLVLNAVINYKSNSFSGMLVVAPSDADAYRLAFTSYFGMTIFDFEVGEKTFVVHHCMEQLERKTILSIFERDFRALLMLDVPSDFRATKYVKGSMVGYRLKTASGKSSYQTDPSRKQWLAADLSGMIMALEIRLSETSSKDFPKIEMNHPKLGLKIEMEKLQED